MRMRSSFEGDLGKSLWKTHYAMGADVDDPAILFLARELRILDILARALL